MTYGDQSAIRNCTLGERLGFGDGCISVKFTATMKIISLLLPNRATFFHEFNSHVHTCTCMRICPCVHLPTLQPSTPSYIIIIALASVYRTPRSSKHSVGRESDTGDRCVNVLLEPTFDSKKTSLFAAGGALHRRRMHALITFPPGEGDPHCHSPLKPFIRNTQPMQVDGLSTHLVVVNVQRNLRIINYTRGFVFSARTLSHIHATASRLHIRWRRIKT